MKLDRTLVAAILLGVAPTAWALPTQRLTAHYYADASFSAQVGSEIALTCSGGHGQLLGQRTEFVVDVLEPCIPSAPIEIQCRIGGVETWCPVDVCDTFGACE